MTFIGRIGNAIFWGIAGLLGSAVLATTIWFLIFWDSEPCGATTCDNESDAVVPVLVATAIGGIASAIRAWRRNAPSRREASLSR